VVALYGYLRISPNFDPKTYLPHHVGINRKNYSSNGRNDLAKAGLNRKKIHLRMCGEDELFILSFLPSRSIYLAIFHTYTIEFVNFVYVNVFIV